MIRVAAIYDIHDNLPALEAVLQDIRKAGVDQIVVGGQDAGDLAADPGTRAGNQSDGAGHRHRYLTEMGS